MKIPYFEDGIEYPGSSISAGCSEGVWYSYVSDSYLNGILNLTKPILAFKLERYDDHDEAAFQALIKDLESGFHTGLHRFKDDILLLCRVPDESPYDGQNDLGSGRYFLFWFDCDCSDCCLGWFETTDDPETVKSNVSSWVDHLAAPGSGSVVQDRHPIPLTALRGWMKF